MTSRPNTARRARTHSRSSICRSELARKVTHRRGSAQTTGLVLAVLIGLVFIALVGYFAMRAPKPAPDATRGVAIPSPDAPPDIKSLPTTPGAGNILTSEVMFVQLMDKRDPTRLAGVIESSHVEPLESRRYRVDEPRVWVFLKDGRSLLVEAKSGRLYMPDRTKEPEAGTLQGDAVVRLFARQPGDRRVDPSKDQPLLTARMDTIAFDGAVGEVSTPDDFVITSSQTDFYGRTLRILFNESSQRIELLEVREQGKIVHRTDVKTEREEKPAKEKPAVATADATPAAPAAPERQPIETFYNAVFADNVVVSHQKGRLLADRFQVWAHTLDNQLAPGAIGSFESQATRAPGGTSSKGAASATTAADAGATPESELPASEATSSPGELVLTWTGPLVMKPVTARPEELAKQEIALRFEAPEAGMVRFTDVDSGAQGHAETIAYGATTRELRLAGKAADNVVIALADSGSMTTGSMAVDLGTGIAHSEGPGMLVGKSKATRGDAEPPTEQTVTWNEQADFEFFTTDGRINGAVKEAMLAGNVIATDGRAALKSGFLHASFAATPREADARGGTLATGSGGSRLARLRAKEGVSAEDGSGGLLNARELDVAFRAGERQPTPESMIARGNVVAVRDVSVLQSDILSATFEEPAQRKGKDRTRVAAVRADGNVVYTDGNDVVAKADQLRADVPKQIADLSGDNVSVGKDNSQIFGTQLRLDGLARSMEVFGPGRFVHTQPLEAENQAGSPRPAIATWTKGMTYDDPTGVIIASGSAQADSYPDPETHDSMRAERVKLEITPAPRTSAEERTAQPAGSLSSGSPGTSSSKVQRELLMVTAIGGSDELPDGKPASIESRRYAASNDAGAQPTLERLMYLEGATIEMNAATQVLTVPVPGKLLVVDRRESQKKPAAAEGGGSPLASANARGNALFEWDGKLTMDRRAGAMDMTQKVRLTHHRLGDQLATFMECQHLLASIIEEKSPVGADSRDLRGQLRSVVADGGVFARSGTKELTADRVDYDAMAETMLAQTITDSPVAVMDSASPTPLLAKELLWNLRTDQIEVRRPMPMVAPR